MPSGGMYTIGADGTNLRRLGGWAGPSYLPDGDLILFFDNVFQAMRADGTDVRPVDIDGPDLSDLSRGFSYIGHWIPNP